MSGDFEFDVFLSHSSKGKPAMLELAQRLKAVLERPCSPIPGDEGEDHLKDGRSRGISGKAADWRCIRAHFPVSNQVLH
jgi:hypothetical protein